MKYLTACADLETCTKKRKYDSCWLFIWGKKSRHIGIIYQAYNGIFLKMAIIKN